MPIVRYVVNVIKLALNWLPIIYWCLLSLPCNTTCPHPSATPLVTKTHPQCTSPSLYQLLTPMLSLLHCTLDCPSSIISLSLLPHHHGSLPNPSQRLLYHIPDTCTSSTGIPHPLLPPRSSTSSFINTPFPPTSPFWSTLLSSCCPLCSSAPY